MNKMKKITVIIGVGLLLLAQAIPVLAADNAVLSLSATPKEGDSQVKVSCEIDTTVDVTSGKMKIHYDSSSLTLVSTSAGVALSDGMNQINDPLTGNREPGEIILAFASAQTITHQGSLLDMEFQTAEPLKKGDTFDISVEVEQLAGADGAVEAEVKAASITVGGKAETTPEPTTAPEDPDENDNKDDSKNNNKTDSKVDNQNTGSSTDKDTANSKTTSTAKSGTAGSAKITKNVKTGDETNILMPLAGLGGAALLAGAVVVIRKKKKI